MFLDTHGGAFIVGGGEVCRGTGIMTASKVGMRVWSVDYRMPPDHPFPAARRRLPRPRTAHSSGSTGPSR